MPGIGGGNGKGNGPDIDFFPGSDFMLGGISRVVRRIDDDSIRQAEVADNGLSDLKSLRASATELGAVIEQIKRKQATGDDSVQLGSLLDEYGLSSTSSSSQITSTVSQVTGFIESALASRPGGVMLESDLFCLINRRLKLETVLSPSEFHEIVLSLTSRSPRRFDLIQLEGWSVIGLPQVFDSERISELINSYLSNSPFMNVSEFSRMMSFDNSSLALVVLSRIELETGIICRDNGGDFGEIRFYKNEWFK